MGETLHLMAIHPPDMGDAAGILRAGGLVAFPTETVYGLGANALLPEAVERIFAAKGRPAWDPLIVHLASAGHLPQVANVGDALRERVGALAAAFWPGPLTLLLPRGSAVPDMVTAGRATVGVRVPAHPVAQALLLATGLPIAAPSANRFGHVSPTTAQHVLADLEGRIDAVLDGGPTSIGVESTVLDPAPTPMLVYRAGAVTVDMLCDATGVQAEIFTPPAPRDGATPESLPSPGVGIRHYAPAARVVLARSSAQALQKEVQKAVDALSPGGCAGVLLPQDWEVRAPVPALCMPWGVWTDPESLAAELFAALRALEGQGVEVIVAPLPEPGGLRDALRDRLLKAARA